MVVMTTTSWSRKQIEPAWVPTFHRSGGNVVGSQSGHRHIPLVCDDEFLGIGTVGTALASFEFPLLFYSNPSRNIRERRQEARISWCLGGHVDDKNT